MRVYGRVNGPSGPVWVVVTTAPNGDNSELYLTALIQYLKLNVNESPRFGNCGIPGYPSVHRQIPPDYYVQQAQQRYAPFFSSLVITKVTGQKDPTYRINALTLRGAVLTANVAT